LGNPVNHDFLFHILADGARKDACFVNVRISNLGIPSRSQSTNACFDDPSRVRAVASVEVYTGLCLFHDSRLECASGFRYREKGWIELNECIVHGCIFRVALLAA
jgi:hypothetical protein